MVWQQIYDPFGSMALSTLLAALGLAPNLMGAANSSGGVMGKMIDAQSIVVASTATRWINHEGDILCFLFFHSFARCKPTCGRSRYWSSDERFHLP